MFGRKSGCKGPKNNSLKAGETSISSDVDRGFYSKFRSLAIVLSLVMGVSLFALWRFPNRVIDFNHTNGPVSQGDTWRPPGIRVVEVEFSPDGRHLALLGVQRKDATPFHAVKRLLTGQGDVVATRDLVLLRNRRPESLTGGSHGSVGRMAWLPDSTGLLVCMADDWLAPTCRRFGVMNLEGDYRGLFLSDVDVPVFDTSLPMMVAPDGQTVLLPSLDAAGRTRIVRMDLETGEWIVPGLQYETGPVGQMVVARWMSVPFVEQTKQRMVLVAGGEDAGDVRLLEESVSSLFFEIRERRPGLLTLVVQPEEHGGSFRLIVNGGEEVMENVSAFSVHPDGTRIVVQNGNEGLRMFSLTS